MRGQKHKQHICWHTVDLAQLFARKTTQETPNISPPHPPTQATTARRPRVAQISPQGSASAARTAPRQPKTTPKRLLSGPGPGHGGHKTPAKRPAALPNYPKTPECTSMQRWRGGGVCCGQLNAAHGGCPSQYLMRLQWKLPRGTGGGRKSGSGKYEE